MLARKTTRRSTCRPQERMDKMTGMRAREGKQVGARAGKPNARTDARAYEGDVTCEDW